MGTFHLVLALLFITTYESNRYTFYGNQSFCQEMDTAKSVPVGFVTPYGIRGKSKVKRPLLGL